MALLLAAVAALVPLAMVPRVFLYYDITPKIVIILAGVALVIPWHRSGLRAIFTLVSNGPGRQLAWLTGAALVWGAVSTALSSSPELSVGGSSWRRMGFPVHGAILVLSMLAAGLLAGNPDARRLLLRAVTASGTVAALYGIAQYFGLDPLIAPDAYQVGEGARTIVRPPSTLGYANYAAGYYLFVVFFGLAQWSRDGDWRWRVAGIAAAFTGSTGIVMSGTRSAILGLVAGGIVLTVLWRPRLRARVLVAAATLVLAASAFYFSPFGERLRARTLWALEEPLGGARRWLWRDSLAMAGERPLTGFGPETFATEFPAFQSVSLSRAYPDFYHESAHNMFLDMLTAQGIPGFGILLLFCFVGVYWAIRRHADRFATALLAALVAAIVSQQFIVFVAPTALFFHLTIAMVVSLSIEKARAPGRPFPLVRIPSAVGGICLLALAGRLAVADLKLGETQRSLNHGRIEAAMKAYEASLPWQRPGPAADLWYSRALAAAATRSDSFADRTVGTQRAFEAARRAPCTSENRANAWYNLATFCALREDGECTEGSLRSAVAASPNWFKPHWTLARALRLSGRVDEALREALLAVKLSGGRLSEVNETLDEIRRMKETPVNSPP